MTLFWLTKLLIAASRATSHAATLRENANSSMLHMLPHLRHRPRHTSAGAPRRRKRRDPSLASSVTRMRPPHSRVAAVQTRFGAPRGGDGASSVSATLDCELGVRARAVPHRRTWRRRGPQ